MTQRAIFTGPHRGLLERRLLFDQQGQVCKARHIMICPVTRETRVKGARAKGWCLVTHAEASLCLFTNGLSGRYAIVVPTGEESLAAERRVTRPRPGLAPPPPNLRTFQNHRYPVLYDLIHEEPREYYGHELNRQVVQVPLHEPNVEQREVRVE
jgi:hypothetical protein